MRDFHLSLFATYLFLIPLTVGILCEITKVLVFSIRQKRIAYETFLHAGGFPSTHAAFVTSLLIIVWRKMGVESVEFAIALIFACIVWYDAVHVRREVGLQAEALNRLQHGHHFTTRVGHSLFQVLGGIIFGALVTWLGIVLSV